VGESRKNVKEVAGLSRNGSTRYIQVPNMSGTTGETYLDILAYKKFVTQDVVLTCGAICNVAGANGDANINFKFLKYGTGFFAKGYASVLSTHIVAAVVDGIAAIAHLDRGSIIKSVEFPFYDQPSPVSEEMMKLLKLERDFGIKSHFTNNDALRASPGYLTATTNCGDPHASFGNELGYHSVDSSIAMNLKYGGIQFLPALNSGMKGSYIDVANILNK